MTIEQAFNKDHDRIMAIPGVTGLGIGSKDQNPAIVVMVKHLTPELKARLPKSIDGHPVVVEESGEISAL
jgi:hypothetical protein